MRILWLFSPHPDDESFGLARAMAVTAAPGPEVYPLTLTRGEATKVRHKFGWSLEEMGAARHREMQDVKATLDCARHADSRTLPDGQLRELRPWSAEDAIREEMLRVKPQVVVTFPIHGISGFHDHIVTHTAVTRVYLELRGPEHTWLQRLAFFTLVVAPAAFPWHVNVTKPEEIDCVFEASDADMERFHRALDCYVTYADIIAATKIHDVFGKDVHFEIYREDHKPPLTDLCDGLRDR